jgi:hypothetical protein
VLNQYFSEIDLSSRIKGLAGFVDDLLSSSVGLRQGQGRFILHQLPEATELFFWTVTGAALRVHLLRKASASPL